MFPKLTTKFRASVVFLKSLTNSLPLSSLIQNLEHPKSQQLLYLDVKSLNFMDLFLQKEKKVENFQVFWVRILAEAQASVYS